MSSYAKRNSPHQRSLRLKDNSDFFKRATGDERANDLLELRQTVQEGAIYRAILLASVPTEIAPGR
jgi:hypothetical protein